MTCEYMKCSDLDNIDVNIFTLNLIKGSTSVPAFLTL